MVDTLKPPLQVLKRRQLLYQAVQEEIKSYIIANGLRPGDPLPSEGELAQQLDISRNSVREAVKSLEALGILEARAGSGLFVRDFTFDSILENLPYGIMFAMEQLSNLMEIRFHIEYGMMERVNQEITPEQLAHLHQVLAQWRTLAEQGHYSASDDRLFHQILYENVDNPILIRILDVFWVVFRHAQTEADLPDVRDPVHTFRIHEKLLGAMERRDSAMMRELMIEHREGIEKRIRQMRSAPRMDSRQPAS
jgi:DNA-binding FadR family transcriptional regulator